MWAQRSFLPKNSELLVTRIDEPKFRGAWTIHLNSIPLVHNALLQLSPKTVPNKIGPADSCTHKSLKGCATPGRLRAAASKKNEIQQFQIDNQILNIDQAPLQEPSQVEEGDDAFTSVSEDNPPDFMEKNYDFTANFLPNEKPRNKNRLTLSGKFFTHPTAPVIEDEEGKENATGNQNKNNAQAKKATNWMEEIELAKRKMIEMQAGPSESTANPPKKYGFFDLLETKGTNLTPLKNPLSSSADQIICEAASMSTPQKIMQTPTKNSSLVAPRVLSNFSTPIKTQSAPTTSVTSTPQQDDNQDQIAQTTPTRKEEVETNEIETTEIDESSREDDLATTELFINNLKNVFDQSINLYYQLISREGAEEKERMILGKFQDLFSHMKNELEDVMPSEQKSQQMLLENYSELLVSLVKSKLG